jgi:ankyrin repeat protein
MSKKPLSPQLVKEAALMVEITTPFISKMIKNKKLSVEKLEVLNLQIAAKNGFCSVMEILLTTGEANVNAFDSIRGNTALHFAVYFRQLKMVELLVVKFGAKIIKNEDNLTPVDLAKDRAPQIYEYLINLKKDEHKDMEIGGDQLDGDGF